MVVEVDMVPASATAGVIAMDVVVTSIVGETGTADSRAASPVPEVQAPRTTTAITRNNRNSRMSEFRQFACSDEHVIEHVGCQSAGEGVLLARVKRADNRSPVIEGQLEEMAELRFPCNAKQTGGYPVPEVTEGDEHSHVVK